MRWGSGKTVVAIAAMLAASGANGMQAAMMAPTEVLAGAAFHQLAGSSRVSGRVEYVWFCL